MEQKECKQCETLFEMRSDTQKYCSPECAQRGCRKFEVSAEELQRLVLKMPTTHVAKLFGVSDVAVSKRCKLLGVAKPERGYWAVIQAAERLTGESESEISEP